MPIFRYHIASFFSCLSHYAFVELVVEKLVAHNFRGKYDCASVPTYLCVEGIFIMALFFFLLLVFSSFHFILKKKKPHRIKVQNDGLPQHSKSCLLHFCSRKKKRVDSRSSTRLEKKSTISSCRRWTLNTFFLKRWFSIFHRR